MLHAGGDCHRVRTKITNLLVDLTPHGFMRIHRSVLVNLGRVRELRLGAGGDYEVVLVDGQRLGLSRLYRARLEERLSQGVADA